MRIPRKLHFITGLLPDFGGKPFSFVHYMAVRSALHVNPAFEAFVYYQYEPNGPYWDLIKPEVTCVPVTAPDEVFGKKLRHYAHKTDLLRLEVLIREGGVYLDFDTICLKPFEPLFAATVVMGIEWYIKGMGFWKPGTEAGLCNAMIIAPQDAKFLKIWRESFREFDENLWHGHAVLKPAELSWQYPDLIKIYPTETFFWPRFDEPGLRSLFQEVNEFPDAVSIHLWETLSWRFISDLDYDIVTHADTSYNLLARRFLEKDRAALWRISAKNRPIEAFPGIETVATGDAGTYIKALGQMLQYEAIKSVVELDCGDWRLSQAIDWSGISYTGFDPDPEMLEQAAKRHERQNIKFRLFSAATQIPPCDLLICPEPRVFMAGDSALGRFMLITGPMWRLLKRR